MPKKTRKNKKQRKGKTRKNKMKRFSKLGTETSMSTSMDNVWGKNKPLEKFWQGLANGKYVIAVYKNNTHKYITTTTQSNYKKNIDALNADPNVVAILTSSMSTESYEKLYDKVKNSSVEYVLNNYKKYFLHKMEQKMLTM